MAVAGLKSSDSARRIQSSKPEVARSAPKGAPAAATRTKDAFTVQNQPRGMPALQPKGRTPARQANALTAASGAGPRPEFANIYKPFQLTANTSVPSHLGVHWGPMTKHDNLDRVWSLATQLKERGVGFSTVLVDPNNVEAQLPTLRLMRDAGITPVIRLMPGGSYDRTMDELSEPEMQAMASAAIRLGDEGFKIIQLDNEPNNTATWHARLNNDWDVGPSLDRYVNNTVHVMDMIREQRPDIAVGFGALATGPQQHGEWAHWDTFWDGMMHRFADANNARGGQLLSNAWIAVHPYARNEFNADGKLSDGVHGSDWLRENARAILGVNTINVLATEGGNPQVNGSQERDSNNINMAQFRAMNNNPQETQCLWIGAADFLTGRHDSGEWENNALIKLNGSGGGDPNLTFRNMLHAFRGENLE